MKSMVTRRLEVSLNSLSLLFKGVHLQYRLYASETLSSVLLGSNPTFGANDVN